MFGYLCVYLFVCLHRPQLLCFIYPYIVHLLMSSNKSFCIPCQGFKISQPQRHLAGSMDGEQLRLPRRAGGDTLFLALPEDRSHVSLLTAWCEGVGYQTRPGAIPCATSRIGVVRLAPKPPRIHAEDAKPPGPRQGLPEMLDPRLHGSWLSRDSCGKRPRRC